MTKQNKTKQIIVYQAKTGAIELRGDFSHETIWATQAEVAKIFNVNSQAITKHIKNIYNERELLRSATCSKMEQVQQEGSRTVKRNVEVYNLEMLIAVGYRINSVIGTNFRQWATKTLHEHIVKGYTINPQRIATNYDEFMKAVADIKKLLPTNNTINGANVLELISAFAETWLSLEAYDKDDFNVKGTTTRTVSLTAVQLNKALTDFKTTLISQGLASELFGMAKHPDTIAGIVGNVMQSFGGQAVYPTIEAQAANLLYFIIKNHPFVDGNKRSGAYAFVWFLQKTKLLNRQNLTPPALTALTLFIAESAPKNKERMIGLVLRLLKK